jgi:hypothetical protein
MWGVLELQLDIVQYLTARQSARRRLLPKEIQLEHQEQKDKEHHRISSVTDL